MRFDLVADAQQEDTIVVGMGHARRCLALGEALRKKGISARLFLPDPSLAERMFSHHEDSNSCSSSSWFSWEDLWQEEAREAREMLVVDSYRLASLPERVRRRYKQIACFHDDLPPPSFASIAICCDLSTKNFDRSSACNHSLGGGQYFPFHDRFARNAVAEKRGDDRLLLWFGGRERGEKLVPLLAEDVLGAWHAEVVISPAVTPCDELVALARDGEKTGGRAGGRAGVQVGMRAGVRARMRVYNEAGAMDALLARCSVYFGGAGVAACEAALLGLKLILCPVASNQLGNARALEGVGAKVLHPPLLPDAVRAALLAVERQPPLALDTLGLDGRGAERLAQALCERVAS